jgi:hypothetical protein
MISLPGENLTAREVFVYLLISFAFIILMAVDKTLAKNIYGCLCIIYLLMFAVAFLIRLRG